MITPTIGRKLWYWPTNDDRIRLGLGDDIDQPMDASVCYVHSDRKVNLTFMDHRGRQHRAPDTLLLQGDEDYQPVTGYATWMPYQQEAEAKANRASKKPTSTA